MRKIKFTETVLRDGHQSLMATRLSTEDMLDVIELMDSAGYHAMECWGGATFDSCIRFLNEDPWDRLRKIRERAKKTKLQMLLRGQNLLGYRHYADDVVEKFIEKSIANGIDIIRVFDALNDLRNVETSLKAIQKHGGHAQLAVSYTVSPIHTTQYYSDLAEQVENMGADSICIKDMAGVLTPLHAKELISGIKKKSKLNIELHTHATSGVSEMTYLYAVESGVDIIDTAISPFSGGTSQPATESLHTALDELGYVSDLNNAILDKIADYFKPLTEKYLSSGILNPKMLGIDPKSLLYQVPGGMLSNLYSQLKQANAQNKYEEVLKEVPRVRKDLGYPPLVTPISQMVGTQAVFNVLSGERYKMVPKEIKDYVAGAYGKPPVNISEDIIKKIIQDREIITARPADLLSAEWSKIQEEAASFAKSEEDCLTYAMFPETARNFLKNKYQKDSNAAKESKTIKIHAIMG